MKMPDKISEVMFTPCGIADFMSEQAIRFACPQCRGVISLHDAVCSECKVPAERPF